MKRLGIMVFFDADGRIDSYVNYLLSSMQKLFHKMVFVINGYIQERDYLELKKHTQFIFIRENKGFDAGAYRDVFLNYIPRSEWSDYGEVLLMNDTFYGPFYPIIDIWNLFEQVKTDFWGITKHPQGRYEDGQEMPAHIQGYFLVVRKKLLQDRAFLTFWEEMPKLNSVEDAVKEFEIKFTTYFEECGFSGKSLMDLGDAPFTAEYNQNPYLDCNLRLIRDKKIPFLKKKSLFFQLSGYEETIDAIEYIEKEGLYDTSMIWENILRLNKENRFRSIFNYAELEDFYDSHHRIFIFGAGKYGQRMKKYFEYRKWSYVCFLGSGGEDMSPDCKKYSDIVFGITDGIIIALNYANLRTVRKRLEEMVAPEQLFAAKI